MRSRLVFALLVAAVLPTIATASGTYSPPTSNPPSMPSTPPPGATKSPEEQAAEDRGRAGDLYKKAFQDAYAAKDELAAADSLRALADKKSVEAAEKKEKSAKKKLEKSVDRLQEAVELVPGYHEAWNMLGFSQRKLGRTDKSFEAYERCLSIAPDYEPAHEYLGEAYLMSGNLEKAEWQLAWLQQRKSEWAATLERSIEKFKQRQAAVPALPAAATSPDSH
jgi:tetratricopeptide (TPR) repeat protein